MNKIINYGSLGFITTVLVMTAVSLLGVWDILVDDVILKSLTTVGFLAFVSIVVVVGYRFMHPDRSDEEEMVNTWRPVFTHIRKASLSVMIMTAALLGLLGVLGIWEVLNEDFFWRALSSIAIIAIAATVIAAVCFEREGRGLWARAMHTSEGGLSFWKVIVAIVIFGWLLAVIA